ncbi:MAG: efflux RND transporter periplasmic adaptor subunit [Burkholderiales bacterium]|nr:efflux RND transporter periplasmic adaptor subunit [Burkholderiales bacterium]
MLFKRSTLPSLAGSARKRNGWVKLSVAGLSLVLVIGSLVAWRANSAKKEEKKPDINKVFELAASDVATFAPQNLGLVIPVSGSVRPVLQAMVKSKVSGEVSQVHVREGERVNAGQVLASIDTSDLRARHDTQLAMVAESRAKLDLAKKNEQNNRMLLAKNFISQTAFDSVASGLEVSESNYKSTVAQAAITQRALADAQIRAPFAGIVAKRAINVGEKVSTDAPVMHIVDLSRMELEAPVPVSDIPSIKVGQEIAFKVDGFSEREFKGNVERINPAAEMGSRSISIFVALPNKDGALKGGMFATGTLAAASRATVNAIPLAALIAEGGQSFVYALNDGKVERKPITPGNRSVELGLVEVRDGLPLGAQVITVKADGLKHGASVVVRARSAPPAVQPASNPKTSAEGTSVAKS